MLGPHTVVSIPSPLLKSFLVNALTFLVRFDGMIRDLRVPPPSSFARRDTAPSPILLTPTPTPTPTPIPPPPPMVVDINAPMVDINAKNRCRKDTEKTARNGHGKKRTRPVYKLTKRQDNLELSYLCSIFVSLKEWQDTDTATNHGKAMTRTRTRQVGVVTTPRHGKKKHTASRKDAKRTCSVYNLEMNELQFGIVIPLSYLCIVEEH